MARSPKDSKDVKPQRPPATTPEARENQLISLAVDQAEKQLRDGSASSQVITHFLKLATVREVREREKLELENELLKAKTAQIGSQAEAQKRYDEAIEAFKTYSGNGDMAYDDY